MLKIDKMAAKKVSIFDVFLLFWAKWPKRVIYSSTKSHSTAYPARSSYQDLKSSIEIKKFWELTKWRPKRCLFFYVFLQNGQNASSIYQPNLTTLHIQLDLVTRIPNLQTEFKSVENWWNGGQKKCRFFIFFWLFLTKWPQHCI